jgi:hypothetical protein
VVSLRISLGCAPTKNPGADLSRTLADRVR